MKDSIASVNLAVSLYKGQKVTVYDVDKTEISLTRQDLVELVNVCTVSLQGRIQGACPPIFGKVNFLFYIVYNVWKNIFEIEF